MGYPATKMIYEGTAYKNVDGVVSAILEKTKNPDDVYAWFGEKTASLSSTVSVAKKNLGLIVPKVAKDESRPLVAKKGPDLPTSVDTMFCPYCGKQNKAPTVGISNDANGTIVSKRVSIKCSCGKHSQVVI